MIANIFLCFILTVPMVFIILFLPQIINVSDALVKDVTGLFILVFSHFLVDLLDKVFINSAYVLNRLDLVEESMVFGLPSEDDKNDVKLSVKVVYNKEIAKDTFEMKLETKEMAANALPGMFINISLNDAS